MGEWGGGERERSGWGGGGGEKEKKKENPTTTNVKVTVQRSLTPYRHAATCSSVNALGEVDGEREGGGTVRRGIQEGLREK